MNLKSEITLLHRIRRSRFWLCCTNTKIKISYNTNNENEQPLTCVLQNQR